MTKDEADKQFMKIGNRVASLWGATCEDWEILRNGKIRFYCNECGEKFTTELTPEELQQYNY